MSGLDERDQITHAVEVDAGGKCVMKRECSEGRIPARTHTADRGAPLVDEPETRRVSQYRHGIFYIRDAVVSVESSAGNTARSKPRPRESSPTPGAVRSTRKDTRRLRSEKDPLPVPAGA